MVEENGVGVDPTANIDLVRAFLERGKHHLEKVDVAWIYVEEAAGGLCAFDILKSSSIAGASGGIVTLWRTFGESISL